MNTTLKISDLIPGVVLETKTDSKYLLLTTYGKVRFLVKEVSTNDDIVEVEYLSSKRKGFNDYFYIRTLIEEFDKVNPINYNQYWAKLNEK